MLASSYLVLVLLVLSLSLCFSIFLSLCMYVYLSVYLSLYICLSVTLSVCLYLPPPSISLYFPPYLSPLSLSLNLSLSFYLPIKNFLLLEEQIIFCWTRTFLKKIFNVITDVTYVLTSVT
jgi:hypothetical protein